MLFAVVTVHKGGYSAVLMVLGGLILYLLGLVVTRQGDLASLLLPELFE